MSKHDTDEEVAEELNEFEDTNMKNVELLDKLMKLERHNRLAQGADASPEEKALANLQATELIYLRTAVAVYQSDEPSWQRFRAKLGAGANNIQLIAKALQAKVADKEADDLFNQAAGVVIARQGKARGGGSKAINSILKNQPKAQQP